MPLPLPPMSGGVGTCPSPSPQCQGEWVHAPPPPPQCQGGWGTCPSPNVTWELHDGLEQLVQLTAQECLYVSVTCFGCCFLHLLPGQGGKVMDHLRRKFLRNEGYITLMYSIHINTPSNRPIPHYTHSHTSPLTNTTSLLTPHTHTHTYTHS